MIRLFISPNTSRGCALPLLAHMRPLSQYKHTPSARQGAASLCDSCCEALRHHERTATCYDDDDDVSSSPHDADVTVTADDDESVTRAESVPAATSRFAVCSVSAAAAACVCVRGVFGAAFGWWSKIP